MDLASTGVGFYSPSENTSPWEVWGEATAPAMNSQNEVINTQNIQLIFCSSQQPQVAKEAEKSTQELKCI